MEEMTPEEMEAELEADSILIITRQGDLLTGVANALKGTPPELVSWSHHDLPEVAEKTVAEMEAMAEKLEACRDVLRAITERGDTDFYASDFIRLCRILGLVADVEDRHP